MLPLGRQAQRLAGAATRQGYRTRCVGSAAPATEAPCGAAPAEGAVPAELAAEAARGARGGRERQALPPVAPPSEEVLRRNAELVERLKGELILAPLTRGGHLPFRRLCADFGARATMGEMTFARLLLKGDRVERTRLKKAGNETLFGFQMATNVIDEGVRAAELAVENGASWVDLNCGCPIYEATRRGLGTVLLRKPAKLARLVAGIVAQSPIPVTVKVRTGENDKKMNLPEVLDALAGTGAAAVTVHGRTSQQRYKNKADWDLIAQSVGKLQPLGLPLIGNGDILTHFEARARLADSGVHALMVGRGALVKPWVFHEYIEGRPLHPTARERVGIYRKLVSYMREHFGDDERGRRKAFYFLPFSLQWMARYRPFPEEAFGQQAAAHPLILTRWDTALAELGEELESLPLLERLLRCEAEACHEELAAALWDARSDEEAAGALERMADRGRLQEWEDDAKGGRAGKGSDRTSRSSRELDVQG